MRVPLVLSLSLLASPLARAQDDAGGAAPVDEGAAAAPAAEPVSTVHAAPEASAPALDAAEEVAEEVDEEPASDLCPDDKPCLKGGPFAAWPALRLRVGYELVQPDEQVLFVGHNDGFYLDHARVGFETTYRRRFWVRLVVDMASALPGQKPNDPVAPLVGAARDAYIAWTPSDYFFLSVGQQFMPFDYEDQVSRATFNFTSRSVATGGVRAGHGYETEGLGPDRQLGVVLGAKRAPLGPVGLDYRLGISNGNDKNHLGNDNKLPAVFARLGASLNEWVAVGVAGEVNPKTTGALPNLFTETHVLVAGDVRLDVFGIDVLGQAIWRRISFDDLFLNATDPNAADHSLGLTTWIVLDEPFGLPTFGFKPGYRFSFLDPYFSDPDDLLIEHTLSVRYDPPTSLPLAFLLDATVLLEGAELDETLRANNARYLDNNRLVALVQFDL